MRTIRFIQVNFILALLLAGTSASAQNAQIIGGSSLARACYQASTTATLIGSANRNDLDLCEKAIREGGLNRKDLIATYVNRGIVYVAMQDYVKAAKDYERAIDLSDDTAEAYINRGNLWFIAQHYQEAVDDYARALELNVKKMHVALLNRGMANEHLGNLTEAKNDYLSALELVQEWPPALAKLERVNKKIQ